MAVKKNKRREAARQSLREEILAASRAIIAEEGFDALTMRRLAERIGYSPATLYLHFKNRDEIAQAVGRIGYADLYRALSAAVADAAATPAQRTRSLAHAYVRFGLENPQTYALIFMEDPAYIKAVFQSPQGQSSQAVAEEKDPATAAYEILIGNAAGLIATGLIPFSVESPARPATPTEIAESFWASLHGIVSLKLTCPGFPSAPAELLTDLYLETLLRGPSSGVSSTKVGKRAK